MIEVRTPPGRSDYLARRESQERMLADRSADRAVRCAHLAMANRYAALIREETLIIVTQSAA